MGEKINEKAKIKDGKVTQKQPDKYRAKVRVNVREGAHLTNFITAVIEQGEVVKAWDEKDGWLKVDDGWTMAKYFDKE